MTSLIWCQKKAYDIFFVFVVEPLTLDFPRVALQVDFFIAPHIFGEDFGEDDLEDESEGPEARPRAPKPRTARFARLRHPAGALGFPVLFLGKVGPKPGGLGR